jgi:hypothetical protein
MCCWHCRCFWPGRLPCRLVYIHTYRLEGYYHIYKETSN